MSEQHGSQPTIFLIEEDDDTRPILKGNLKAYGYRVLLALDEEDAQERLGDGVVQADLLLLNLVGKTARGSFADRASSPKTCEV